LIYRNEQSIPAPQIVPFEKGIVPGKSADIILPVSASPYGYGFVARSESDLSHRSSQTVSVLLIGSDGQKLGVLEFSNGPSYGMNVIASVTTAWLIASVFAMAIAALAGWFMSRRVTQPVLALENATRQMEQGNLGVRVNLQNERQHEFTSLANSFNGMAAQVEQTISTLRAFVADAAHELHTPLTALQANLELARDEESVSERTHYLTRAREQGQRLEALVKSLLDLSRLEAAESKSDFAHVDILQMVREVGEQFASRAEQAERIFTMELPEQAVQLIGNETQLRQVVINLLENALKFTPAQGTIALRLEALPAEIQLIVSDSGIGIPPEDQSHLFERFHRARNVSQYPGNGLGLAIVKAIVDLHRGDVSVRSVEKQGTVIKVSFPKLTVE
jgi:signal transduction histidine kinase